MNKMKDLVDGHELRHHEARYSHYIRERPDMASGLVNEWNCTTTRNSSYCTTLSRSFSIRLSAQASLHDRRLAARALAFPHTSSTPLKRIRSHFMTCSAPSPSLHNVITTAESSAELHEAVLETCSSGLWVAGGLGACNAHQHYGDENRGSPMGSEACSLLHTIEGLLRCVD